MTDATFDADVAIVGYGPVGQALAAWLGAAGHRVAIFERFEEIYRLPRAVHLDHEIMRLLQSLGVTDALAGDLLPFRHYHWFGADGDLLMRIDAQAPGVSGWEPDYMFFQPALEAALDGRAREYDGVTVERGWIADGLEQDADGARLKLRDAAGDTRTVRARYVIGADGANSFVRETSGIERRDLGFRERWLVVDVAPHDMAAIDLPIACQWCDPARPTTHVQSGTGHRRWEFMLLPGESPEDFQDEQRSWDLLAPWFTPADGVLLRHAVYEFRSVLAERLRDGRVLLAGDAAHLTPPFLGQGLCAGLRDAANIAWKLDLVLRGRADPALLDTVTAERQPQNEWIIAFAVELGKALCQLDPQLAAERDAAIRAAGPPPHVALPPIAGGIVRADDPLGGQLAVQGRVAGPDGDALLDDVTGGGFRLIAAGALSLDDDLAALAAEFGIRTVVLDPGAPGGLRDLDGRMTAWLAEHAAHAVLVRPDFYVFGSARSAADVPALLRDLREQLSPTTA